MPAYRVTSPDGAIFNVTAPDDATEQEVLARTQAYHASAAPAAANPQVFNAPNNSKPGVPSASANSNGSLPDWFGTMPEFAKRNYLLSLAQSVSNQSSGVVQPLTSFLLGLMGTAGAGRAANAAL